MCLDDQVLSTYIDGELAEPWKTQVEEHLLHCSGCKSRYNQLVDLGKDIKSARLREEEYVVQRERIWQYLEKNCVALVKERFIEKRLSFRAPVLVVAAAAIILFFSAGIYFASNTNSNTIPEIPVISSQTESEGANSIVQVRATDSAPAAQSLQDLSIEEILQLLDDRGFEVDLRLKSVEPLTVSLPKIDHPDDGMIEVFYDVDGVLIPEEKLLLAEVLYDVDGNLIPIEDMEALKEELKQKNADAEQNLSAESAETEAEEPEVEMEPITEEPEAEKPSSEEDSTAP